MNDRRLLLIFIAAVLIMGIGVRYVNLENHFTHVDDIDVARTILYEKELRKNSPGIKKMVRANLKASSAIAANLTYAPFQFYVTPWLIHLDQSYKEVLFWGRFPSFIVGILALIFMAWLHFKLNKDNPCPYQLISVALLAFSWENIIYTQQMESYAIGVMSLLLLIVTLIHFASKEKKSSAHYLFAGAICAALAHTQYQILFFIPAFYLTWSVYSWKNTDLSGRYFVMKNLVLSGIVFALLTTPMYLGFLRHHVGRGVNWNAGPIGEFLFDWSGKSEMMDKVLYAFQFFTENFISVFQMELAFMPQEYGWYKCISYLMLLLFGLGIVSLVRSEEKEKRLTGTFFLCSAIVWILLIIVQKITLSPTRHNLILLPVFIIGITEGVSYVIQLIVNQANRRKITTIGSISISVVIVASFFFSFKEVTDSRKDPFSSEYLKTVLKKYKVRTIISYDFTRNVELMKNIRNEYLLFDASEWSKKNKQYDNLGVICLVSSRSPYRFSYLNSKTGLMSLADPIKEGDIVKGDYKMIFKKEISSDVEVDFSYKTKNGTNNFYLYIFRKENFD